MKKRLFSVLVVVVLLAGIITAALLNIPFKDISPEEASSSVSLDSEAAYDKETIYLWYSDDTLTNYLTSAAVEYSEKNKVRVMPQLEPSAEFFETINKAAVESNVPDLYITSHDNLGKAYMAGLTQPILMTPEEFDQTYISQAKNSVTYKDSLLGYPLSYETSVLLYNETYLKDMAISALTAQKDEEAAADNEGADDNSSAATESKYEFTDDEIAQKIQELIPVTVNGITDLGNGFDAPEGVESFMTWDVTDIFYNYFFLGDAINIGGDSGWDSSQIDIYNENAIKSFSAYQELNQFFSIDTSNSQYSQIISDFMEGKIVLTIATSDAISTLDKAIEDGTFKYDYGVAMVPDINEELDTRSMSVTNCVVINPFSTKQEVANDFAKFLTTEYAVNLYQKSGKASPAVCVNYDDVPAFNVFAMEYGYSYPLPKMMETSNLWVILEGAFADIWDGDDPNQKLKEVAEQINFQLTGEQEELEYIEIKEETEDVEYYDEEELMRQAQQENQDTQASPAPSDNGAQ